MVVVLSVFYCEREYICFFGDGMYDLSDCIFFFGNEFDGCKFKWNFVMMFIDVFYWFEGFDDLFWKWRDDVLDFCWN